MLALILVAAVGSYGLACAGWANLVDPDIVCDQPGAIALIRAFIAAPEIGLLIANQAIYAISPKTAS